MHNKLKEKRKKNRYDIVYLLIQRGEPLYVKGSGKKDLLY